MLKKIAPALLSLSREVKELSKISFNEACSKIENHLLSNWHLDKDSELLGNTSGLDIQKRAIIGYDKDVRIFSEEIKKALQTLGIKNNFYYPSWYTSEEDALFHEIWGKAGLIEWWRKPYSSSSSAKIIGENIYFLVDGQMKKMPQKINKERRDQLIRAFLLLSPEERLDKDFHEIYLLDGCRVTVFKGEMTKAEQDVVIFRRYVIPEYTFEEQANRNSIPLAAVPLFKSMVDIGYNVAFCGSVRSAKTTFLATWQSYENPLLEGVLIETDPEVPLDKLMPDAPIVQLIADGERLNMISKNLLRSDADYFIIAEARDGIALDTAIRLARKGSGRMKMTFHTRTPLNFPEDAAVEIVRSKGGDIAETALRVASSFDYIFYFAPVRLSGRKILKGIYEMGIVNAKRNGSNKRSYYINEICRYSYKNDDWIWNYKISKDKQFYGEENDHKAFSYFRHKLKELSGESIVDDE